MNNPDNTAVICIHGMGRTHRSMWRMAKILDQSGYTVTNFGYPSTKYTIETLADKYLKPVIKDIKNTRSGPLYVVTHSMGGLLIRQYCQNNHLPDGSRIVMLAPPNHGSEIVDHVKNHHWFKWLDGPAGQQMGTTPDAFIHSLQAIRYEIGIIAGDRSIYPPLSWWLSKPNDGLVSVASTRLEEMQDFIQVRAGHMLIMNKPDVIEQTRHFLEYGCFTKPPASP